ncbi:MAG: pyridoxal phosphate-dependent aminotransferase, partial [Oscillospiraceae bacterium]
TCQKPYATYLLFPNIQATGMGSQAFVDFMQENAKLAIVPGTDSFFGPSAEGYVRICFATSFEILKEGLDRFEKGLEMMYNR